MPSDPEYWLERLSELEATLAEREEALEDAKARIAELEGTLREIKELASRPLIP